jgi:hypothetical protein
MERVMKTDRMWRESKPSLIGAFLDEFSYPIHRRDNMALEVLDVPGNEREMSAAIQPTQTSPQKISNKIRTWPPVRIPEGVAVSTPRSSRRLRTQIIVR